MDSIRIGVVGAGDHVVAAWRGERLSGFRSARGQGLAEAPEEAQACLEEGYDVGTTEYAECVEELSKAD